MSPEEFIIMTHENALSEMELRALRLARNIKRQQDELSKLLIEVEYKKSRVCSARNKYLQGVPNDSTSY
jgi:hypothetical protein